MTGQRKWIKKSSKKGIVYEPQKCVKCGICVRMTEKYRKARINLYWQGFDIAIRAPFREPLDKALMVTAMKVAMPVHRCIGTPWFER